MTGVTTGVPQDGDGERILLARIAKGETDGNTTLSSQLTALNTLANGTGGAARSYGSLLASAARTATTSSSVLSCGNCSAALFTINVTAASGTGGLKLRIVYYDINQGIFVNMFAMNTGLTAVAAAVLIVGKGIGTVFQSGALSTSHAIVNIPLPTNFRIDVVHGDSSSYTYSVDFEYIP